MKDYKLNSNSKITSLFKEAEIEYWGQAIEYVKKLPYGRNKDRADFSLVLNEKKGTCSSKHALLKLLANENEIPNVILILGVYRMNIYNTDGIKKVIEKYDLDYIPEAHCYLEIEGEKYDFTRQDSYYNKFKKYLIHERKIEPIDVVENKIRIHRDIIESEIENNNMKYSLDSIWEIREECINAMEKK
ncbi:MAG: hypothetical protein ACE364_05140 [Chlorobiota bacterium]